MLSLSHFTCRRQGRAVFAPLSLELKAGNALLLAGPNGSGKTSLLRGIAGLLPHEGEITLTEPFIYIGHRNAVQDELRVAEHVEFWSSLAEIPAPLNVLETFGLQDVLTKRAAELSQGQKRRLALTRLLINPAPLWLLDEPQAALDAEAISLLESIIALHRQVGGAIIIASHGGLETLDAATLMLGAA